MKRAVLVVMAMCLLFPVASATALTALAAGNNTVILFEKAEQNGNTVKIDVNVRENSGIYSMLLTLDYDTSVLTLTEVAFGTALKDLEPMASADCSVIPYRISYIGTNDQNDTTTGKLMTLTFAVKENAPDGKYTVTFDYTKNQDVTYLKDGSTQTKNLVIAGATLTLKDNGVESITTSDTEQGADETNEGGALGWIIAGSLVGVAAVAISVGCIVRRNKRKWVKL